MTLSCMKLGDRGVICSCDATGAVLHRLENLGLLVGTPVSVLSCTNGGLIVDVRGSRLALGKDAADCLNIADCA